MESTKKKSQFGLRLFLLLVALVASLTGVWSAKQETKRLQKSMLRNEYGIYWDPDAEVRSESNRQYNLDLFRAQHKISDSDSAANDPSDAGTAPAERK
jgi:hypothetical protein